MAPRVLAAPGGLESGEFGISFAVLAQVQYLVVFVVGVLRGTRGVVFVVLGVGFVRLLDYRALKVCHCQVFEFGESGGRVLMESA